MGEGCELWGGNERKQWDGWGGMYVCGGGEEKRKVGYMGGGEKNMEWGLRVWWEKYGEWKRKKKKNLKGKKLNWFYLYVHFVWCKI